MSGEGASTVGPGPAELAERLAASATQAAALAGKILLDLGEHTAAMQRIWQRPATVGAQRRAGQGA